MEPLDLAGRGRRPWRGEQVPDAVLPTDPIEEHLTVPATEPAGEHLAVVGQDLLRGPHGVRIARPSASHVGRAVARATTNARDTEPRVVIDPGHDRRSGPIGEPDPADDVHLPQLHRPRPFPTPIVGPLPPPATGVISP